MKKKFLIIGGKGDYSGVPTYLKKFLALCRSEAWEISLIYGSDLGGFDEIKSQMHSHISVPKLESTGSVVALIAVFRTLLYVYKLKPDIIFCHTFMGILSARIYSWLRRSKVRLCVVHHGLPFDDNTSKFVSFVGILSEKLFRASRLQQIIVAISRKNYKQLVNFYSSKNVEVVYIPNSIELTHELLGTDRRTSSKSEKRGVWVGRDSYQKDPELLAKIAKSLPYNYSIDVWGYFSENRQLYLKDLSNGRLNFCGSGEIERSIVYGKADFFIQTSRYEGFSFAMLEAAQYGLPILTTSVSGASDLRDSYSTVEIFIDELHAIQKIKSLNLENHGYWLNDNLSDQVWSDRYKKVFST